MPVPSSINDIFTTAGSNPPGGGETPAEGDNHIRAAYSFIAALRDILNGTSSTTAAVQTLVVSGAATFNGNVTIGNAGSDTLTINPSTITLAGTPTIGGAATWDGSQAFNEDPVGHITGSTYTPTLTNVNNVTSSTAFECQYARVGSVVTVSGKVTIDPTTISSSTSLGMSLPIASGFTAEEQLAGTFTCPAVSSYMGAIKADFANDRATFTTIAAVASSQDFFFTFQYQVI